MVEFFVAHFRQEWSVIKQMPATVVILLILGGTMAWTVSDKFYERQVETQASVCTALQTRIDLLEANAAKSTPVPAPILLPAALTPMDGSPPSVMTPQPSGLDPGPRHPDQVHVYLSTTPLKLLDGLDGMTSVQAESAGSIYVGKWMRLVGRVDDVSSLGEGRASMTLNESDSIPRGSVRLHFGTPWGERASVMSKGAALVANCKVAEVSTWHLLFDTCELPD